MKKSNYLVLAISALVSIFLLYLWYALGFNQIDSPLDLVITIIWWALIVLLVVMINKLEKTRQQRIRTVYLAPGALYNSETGVRELEEGTTPIEAMQTVLEGLEYDFDTQDLPDRDELDFTYVVKTEEYKPAKDEDDEDAEPTWKGSVIKIDREGEHTETEFDGIEQLSAALA